MENFTLLSEAVTPEVAVLIRAAFIAAVIFGLETLSNVRRKGARQEVKQEVVKREQLSKKRVVRA